VDLDDDKHHHVIDHAFDARRGGHPRVLHIRRSEAKANRTASAAGHPHQAGFDRDEYPPAMSDEGGKGATCGTSRVSRTKRRPADGLAARAVLQRSELRLRVLKLYTVVDSTD
jgi:hypothetical protein